MAAWVFLRRNQTRYKERSTPSLPLELHIPIVTPGYIWPLHFDSNKLQINKIVFNPVSRVLFQVLNSCVWLAADTELHTELSQHAVPSWGLPALGIICSQPVLQGHLEKRWVQVSSAVLGHWGVPKAGSNTGESPSCSGAGSWNAPTWKQQTGSAPCWSPGKVKERQFLRLARENGTAVLLVRNLWWHKSMVSD